MDTAEFTNPSGRLVRNADSIDTFVPNSLPPELSYDTEMTYFIAEAHRKLGLLSGLGQLVPNPNLLIIPYLKREAVLSSRIEGTQASLDDLFLYEAIGQEAGEFDSKRVREVANYANALQETLTQIRAGARIDRSLFKFAHGILLKGVRGQDRNPGQFRAIQNWIGTGTGRIGDAVYVPPSPELIEGCLESLERFILNPTPNLPVLIQCALDHYQFEAIHPFVDGNGRIGRLLIPLILIAQNSLSEPLLYISAYFERNRSEYYQRLRAVSQRSEWIEWIRFFLNAVISQATDAVGNIQKLIDLDEKYGKQLRSEKASKNAFLLAEHIFANPYLTATNAMEYLKVTFPTAQATIEFLMTQNILVEVTQRRRNRIYLAHEVNAILV